MRSTRLALVFCCAFCLLEACSSRHVTPVPGKTTLAELLEEQGPAERVWADDRTGLVLAFAEGNRFALAHVSPEGIMVSIQPVVTEPQIDALWIGMSRRQVVEKLGEPLEKRHSGDGEIWLWHMLDANRPVLWQVDTHFGAMDMLLEIQRNPVQSGALHQTAGHKAHS